MQRFLASGILLVGGMVWAQATPEEIAKRRNADEQTLLDKKIKADGSSLLQFFRERTLSKKQLDEIAAKVSLLGTGSYRERLQAHADLVKDGEKAKPILYDALKNSDLEIVRRVELCLRMLADGPEARLACAAARLLAHHKPTGSAEVILNYLPFATDSGVIQELQEALVAVAVRDGKADAAIVAALTDAKAIKRSAAAAALVRNDVAPHLPKIRALLKDPHCDVRAHVAKVLSVAKDKTAVPVLIDLVADLPSDKVCEIEEMLDRLAGNSGPNIYVGGKDSPAKVRDAWKTWWSKHGDKVNLAKLSETPPLKDLTLITQMGNGLNGRIFEVNAAKEVAWEIDSIRYPIFSQVVGGDRVLVCEYLNQKVTERDFQGKVIDEFPIQMPICCQRHANGDTFIVSRRQLVVLDKDKKEIFTHFAPQPNIAAAHRSRDGQVVVVHSGGECQRLDAKGKLIKAFSVGPVYALGGNIDVLPNGRILVPQYRDNKIAEYDQEGNMTWSLPVQAPTAVTRLPNGNFLVVTMNPQRVLELTREGRQVWEFVGNNRLWSARKR
jgi:hypothetical protein